MHRTTPARESERVPSRSRKRCRIQLRYKIEVVTVYARACPRRALGEGLPTTRG
jgi:hypothetical protein